MNEDLVGKYSIEGRDLERLKEMFSSIGIWGTLLRYRIIKFLKYNQEDGSLSLEVLEEV